MPFLKKLNISKLRNLDAVNILPSSGFNLIYGENGSGKTSLLEAIYLLGRGKTFRSTSKNPIIQTNADESVVYAELNEGSRLGFSRSRANEQKIHINGEKASNSAVLAQTLPLQLLNADAFKILESGPSERRGFLDWGVFHVEQQFHSSWRQAQKALLNRNRLLKNKNTKVAEISPWTHEFCMHARAVDSYRQAYLEKLKLNLIEALNELMPLEGFALAYDKGWDHEQELEDVLKKALQKDIKYGFTGSGPHRADIKIQLGKDLAVEVLSRGQQKLLVFAMKLAQAALLKQSSNKRCVFLLDDLPAELDKTNRTKVISMLAQLGEQVFMTGIEKNQLYDPLQKEKELQLFHVEHGKITAAD